MSAVATHLRSSSRPEAEARGGHIFVWTECGEQENALFVDNETADCRECLHVERSRQEAENDAANDAMGTATDDSFIGRREG